MLVNKLRENLAYLHRLYTKTIEKSLSEIFDNYDEYHKEMQVGNVIRANVFLRWIEEGSSILDIGCADGLIALYMMKQKDLKVVGIDVAEDMVQMARKKGVEAYTMDLNVPFNINEKYDYIIMSEVIEHLIFPHKVLKEMLKVARKGVIISFPNAAWLPYRIQLLRGYSPRQSFTHLHAWSHPDFILFCKEIGAQIIDFRQTHTADEPDVLLQKLLIKINPNLFAHQLYYLLRGKAV